jgi:stearoyl-CoA desaturase (delta-9 desaturase)
MTVATSEKLPIDWVTLIYMAFIHLVALLAFLPSNFSWGAVGVTLILYWITGGLGITLGFHRLVSHRSFKTPKWLEYFLVLCGTLACQGWRSHG